MSLDLAESLCASPPAQENGEEPACPTAYEYGVRCEYRCSPGFQLPEKGVSSLLCTTKYLTAEGIAAVVWDKLPTACEGQWVTAGRHLYYNSPYGHCLSLPHLCLWRLFSVCRPSSGPIALRNVLKCSTRHTFFTMRFWHFSSAAFIETTPQYGYLC